MDTMNREKRKEILAELDYYLKKPYQCSVENYGADLMLLKVQTVKDICSILRSLDVALEEYERERGG